MQLERKVAIVTGAGHGIGKSIATEFAREGADVAVADINERTADETSIAIKEMGQRSLPIKTDVGSLPDIDSMVKTTVDHFGRVDILVNNAGVMRDIQLVDITEDDWDLMFRVNTKGVFFCLQRVAQEMIKQGHGGRIINISSLAAIGHTSTCNVAYASSKGAVATLSQICGHQLARYDINVNSICPGPTKSQGADYASGESIASRRAKELGISLDELYAQRAKATPIGRMNEPEDIAAMALFLAGPGARNITSKTFSVDGGRMLA